MAHAQKPELGFLRNGRVHLNWRGGQFSRLLAAKVCASAVVMVVMLDTPGSEAECKTAGYPLHSPVSPSLPLPCVTVCHQIPRALYWIFLNMLYTLRSFFSSKWSLFHNATFFGSCIIHILYTGCAKIKKNNSGAKGLIDQTTGCFMSACTHLPFRRTPFC